VGSEGGRQRESGRWEVESGKQSNLYKFTEEGKGREGKVTNKNGWCVTKTRLLFFTFVIKN